MSASIEPAAGRHPTGAHRHAPLRCALGALILVGGLLACSADSADSAGEALSDMAPPDTPDLGPGDIDAANDPDCGLQVGPACYDDPEIRCAAVRERVQAGDCVDVDGDCFVGACQDLPTFAAVLRDCDDSAPDVHPAAAESCDEVDHDCDGDATNGYPNLGMSCLECGRGGKYECGVDDRYAEVCSVYAGQSDALSPLPEEICDGADDDCDGRVDEGCRLPSPPDARLDMPALCPDGRVVLIEDAALLLYHPPGQGSPPWEVIAPADRRPAQPACGAAGIAWLEKTGDMPCAAPLDGPATCPARLWFRADGGAATPVTQLPGDFGPPVVTGDGIYWHSVIGGEPRILRWTPDGLGPEVALDGAFSDPTPPGPDRLMALRAWTAGEARVTRVDLDDGSQRSILSASAGQRQPGPPTRSADWLAWSGGGGEQPVLWVVTAAGEDGFRPAIGGGAQRAPKLAGDMLVWRDESDGVTLRWFDLRTGADRVFARGDIAVDGFAVRAGEVAWIERGPDGDRLLRQAFFEPEAEPDMGPDERDMGPDERDMGPDEPDMAPGAPDMAPGAPDMGPAPDAAPIAP